MALPTLILIFSTVTTSSLAYDPRTDELSCESNITGGLREYITEFHNKIRSQLVHGHLHGYESEADIYTMRWDCDLAKLAQERANSCGKNTELHKFSDKIGEIAYQHFTNNPETIVHYIHKSMFSWATIYDSNNRNQIISGRTLLLGCGISKCQEDNKVAYGIFFVCQYWPKAPKDESHKTGNGCESWKNCTLYKDSVCNLNTKLCDLHSETEIHDSFRTFLASNGTINIPNLEDDSTTHHNDSENNNATAQLCNKKIMSDDTRSDILFDHNEIRSQLAYGDFKFLPSGSNIYSLKWSCELEGLAQQYADVYADDCTMSRKQDIHVPFETGQNVFKIRTNGKFTTDQWFDKALNFWANGTQESHQVVQILYGKTLLIGCGIRKCRESEVVIVCQYWPKATPGPLYRQGSSCEADNYCDAYNQSFCDSEMSLCQSSDNFTFPNPLHAMLLQTTPITDASNTENVTNIPSTEGIFNSSESGEEIIQKSAEDQYNCSGTKLLSTYPSQFKKKHEEYRKKAANGIISLHNFEHIQEEFFFKLDWNCELEKKAQTEAEKCAAPLRDANYKYHRTIIHNFEFGDLTKFLDQKIDRAISSWWGNKMVDDNIDIAQFEATEIGCGIATCVDENLQMVLDIVCRYWPTSDPNELYSYAISCARDRDCNSLPNSFCDTDLGICVEAERKAKSSASNHNHL